MTPRAAVGLGAVLLIIAIILLLVFVLDLLPLVLLAIGLVVFVLVVVALIAGAILLVFAVPYYFVTKPAKAQPGSFTLEEIKEP